MSSEDEDGDAEDTGGDLAAAALAYATKHGRSFCRHPLSADDSCNKVQSGMCDK